LEQQAVEMDVNGKFEAINALLPGGFEAERVWF
jgi:hypothetical protein